MIITSPYRFSKKNPLYSGAWAQTGVTSHNVPSRKRHVYVYPRDRWSGSTRLWEGYGAVYMSHTRHVRYIYAWRYGGGMIGHASSPTFY